jgi:hypothetical protein
MWMVSVLLHVWSLVLSYSCSLGLETTSRSQGRSCHEIKAIMAFSFLVWLLGSSFPLCFCSACLWLCYHPVMGYTATLLILAIRAHERGHSAWKTSVRDGVLLYPAAKTMGHVAQAPTALATIFSLIPRRCRRCNILSLPPVQPFRCRRVGFWSLSGHQ